MEERCCPDGVARHHDEELFAPDGHARTFRDEDRLAAEEVRHVLEVQFDAQLACRKESIRHVWILHEPVLHAHVVDAEPQRLHLNLLFRWDVRRMCCLLYTSPSPRDS